MRIGYFLLKAAISGLIIAIVSEVARRAPGLHGGNSPGAPIGNENARKHGGYFAKTMAAARYLRIIARLVKDN